MARTMRNVLAITTAFALVASVHGQTFTDCNPLKVTCPPKPALGTSFNQTFNADSSLSKEAWNTTGEMAPDFASSGATFTVSKQGEAPTIKTNFYMLGGHVEVIMKAAPGQGMISSIVLLSQDLDEIDWEIIGNNGTGVETNYYGKGNQDQRNALYYVASSSPESNFHNYTVNWDSTQVQWILDGEVVRTLKADEAVDVNGTNIFPQTPMQLKVGSWAGGDSTNNEGTIQWAGGAIDYSKGPYTMTVQSIKAVDGHLNATEYTYGDHTGTWDSIQVKKGQSQVAQKINEAPSPSLAQRWAALSSGAKIAVYAGAGAAVALLLALFFFCCCRQRRAGKAERLQAESEWNKEQIELLEQKRMMGDSLSGQYPMQQGYHYPQSNASTQYLNEPYQSPNYEKSYSDVNVSHYR